MFLIFFFRPLTLKVFRITIFPTRQYNTMYSNSNGRVSSIRTPGRGNRRAVQSRYSLQPWNQYATALAKSHRTNNVSVPSGRGETSPRSVLCSSRVSERAGLHGNLRAGARAGRKIKYAPQKKWRNLQMRLENIVTEYNNLPILQCYRTSSLMSI